MGQGRADLLLFFTLLGPALRRRGPGEALRCLAGEGGLERGLLEAMGRELQDGQRLSAALRARPEVFPEPLPTLMAAGEDAGDPAAAAADCARLVRHHLRAARSVAGALVYPALCLVLVAGLAAVQAVANPLREYARLAEAVGAGTSVFGSAAPPEPAGVPAALLDAWWLRGAVAGLTLAAAAALFALFRGPRSPGRDRLLLNLPVVGRLYRWSAATGFTRALGLLLGRGLPLGRALETAVPAAGNAWVEAELRARLVAAGDGVPLSAALDLPGVFPPSLADRLAQGEARGEVGAALLAAAAAYEDDLALYAGRLARTLEPAAILVVGFVALGVAGLILRPIMLVYGLRDMFGLVSVL